MSAQHDSKVRNGGYLNQLLHLAIDRERWKIRLHRRVMRCVGCRAAKCGDSVCVRVRIVANLVCVKQIDMSL